MKVALPVALLPGATATAILAAAIPAVDGASLQAVVSVAPQATLVEAIGGDRVEVTALVGPGQDPHHFSITPRQALSLAKANVYFATEMGFEAGQLPRIQKANPGLRLVNLASGIELREIEDHGHDHGDGEDHAEEGEHEGHDHGADPHIWLSPELLVVQARTVHRTLVELDPGGRAEFDRNLESFTAEMKALDGEVREQLKPLAGETFLVFHPAFGYLADAYGLRQAAVEVGGKKPTPKQLAALIGQAEEKGVKVVFVQPGFDRSAAEQIARRIGGRVENLDPLDPDLAGNIRSIAKTLAETLGRR